MRLKLLWLIVVVGGLVLFSEQARAQNFSFNCARDTLVPACPANLCITLNNVIPDLRRVTGPGINYAVNPVNIHTNSCIPTYLAPNDPAGTPTNLTIDDTYSGVINLGFPFPFYGTTYNSLVASTNGYVSFDVSTAGGFAHWAINNDLPSAVYNRAMIMGVYHDLDPSVTTSPTRRIQYQTWGVAPHRRWILSFYRVPLFAAACNAFIENTHQIILYESTGIIEVKINSKQTCAAWNNGRAIVGIQDFTRTLATMAPGRTGLGGPWTVPASSPESWRFVPTGGTSLFKRAELIDLGGSILASAPGSGTAGSIGNGKLNISFPNICPPAGAITSYIVRSVYEKIDDPATEIFSLDTIRVNRAAGLTGTASFSAGACGANNGVITVSGITGGTPAYQYSITSGPTIRPWQPSNVFTGLAPGTYTVEVRDASGLCTLTLNVVVGQTGFLTASASGNATTCAGQNNGTIDINTPGGGPGPYSISLNGTPVSGTFPLPTTLTGIAAGNYNVVVTHVPSGCTVPAPIPVTVAVGPGVTGDVLSTTPASCFSASNGSATIRPTAGVGPFSMTLFPGGTTVTGITSPHTFTNLPGGSGSSVQITDALGCTSPLIGITIPSGNNSSTAVASASCGPSGGTITITPTGGTAPYEYSIDGGATWQLSNVFTNVTPGTYNNIRVRHGDINCLSIANTVTVSTAPALTGTVTSTNITPCNGATNGSITVTPTSGTSPYSYSIDGTTWLPGGNSYTFSTLLAGNYTVYFRDNAGCQFSQAVTLTEPAPITYTTSFTGTTCNGALNGSITITVTGGASGIIGFSLDGGAVINSTSPATFTNLSAGNHTVRITNLSNNCTSNLITINIPAGPAFIMPAPTTTATSCPGANNGTITITPPGSGTFLFTLNGSNNQTNPSPYTYTGLAAGTYTVTATNNAGCTASVTNVVVAAGPPMTATSTTVPTTCGLANGSITITPTNGTAPYQFSLDGSAPVSGSAPYTFSNLSSGPHTYAVITTASGCSTGPISFNIGTSTGVNGTTTFTATSCPAVNNGTITVTATAGAAPFTFQLDAGAIQPGASPYTFTNVSAGAHTVTIRDNAGCSFTINRTVTAGAALAATGAFTATSCTGVNNGTITITPTNGIAPYTFSLDGAAAVAGAAPYTFTNVASGPHTVVVTDASGCVSNVVNVNVGAGAGVNGTTNNTATSCPTATNGTITVTATAGVAPFTFQLDAGPQTAGTSPFTFTNVASGTHTVIIRDNAGCLFTINNVNVGAGTALAATASSTPTTCGTSTGSITVSAPTGGSGGPYQYSLDGITWQGVTTFTLLAAGGYTVNVRDNGAICSTTIPVTVAQTGSLAATTTTTVASCAGINNGSVTITTAGGTGPYTFTLDGGAAQPGVLPYSFTNVGAGPHTVVVTDLSSACNSGILNVTVTAGAGANGTANSTPTACPAATNGTITVTTTAGAAPFTFQLDGGAFQTGASPYTFTNVAAGAHTVIIRDNVGCTFTLNPGVTAGAALAATAGSTATSCSGINNGTITVTSTNGTAPYTFSLDGGAAVNGAATYTFINVAAGAHTVVVTDAFGCVSGVVNVNVTAGAGVNGTVGSTTTSCPTATNGTITVTATAGVAPFTFQLDGGAQQSGVSPYIFTNVAAGTHTVVIRDNAGCAFTINNVNVTAGLVVSATTSVTAANCGAPTGSITINGAAGGSGAPYQYSLDGITWQIGNIFPNLAGGNYTVRIRDNGAVCITTLPVVTVPQTAAVTATTTTTIANCGLSTGSITVNGAAGGSGGPYQYSLDGVTWQPGNIFSGLGTGNYTVRVRDNAGICITSIAETVGQTSPISATVVANSPATCGNPNGSISIITPSGGTAPYEYSLDGITWQTSNTFSGILGGNLTIRIRDASGSCSATISFTLSQTTAVAVAAATPSPATCGLNNGSIVLSGITGGTPPYQYSLDGITWQPGNTFTGLAGGSYTIRVSDNGAVCSITLPAVTVTQTVAVTATATSTAANCGAPTGRITISGTTGGSGGPYQYSLDGITWQPGNVFTGLAGGNYSVQVRDNGAICSVTIPVTVAQTTAVTATASATAVANCGASTGVITVSAPTGGTAPYEYSLDGITWQPGNIFTGLTGGNYSVRVRDNGAICTINIPVTVAQTAALAATASATAAANCGAPTGIISVATPTGGTAPYEFSLDGITWQPGNVFTGLAGGSYTIRVRDNGAVCNITLPAVTVTQTVAVTATATSTAANCGAPTGSITISGTTGGSGGPYQYSLDGLTWQPGNTFVGLAGGNYTISIRDNGAICSVTILVTVAQTGAVTATASATTAANCGASTGVITVSAPTGGTAPYEFSLDGITWQTGNTFTGLAGGSYTIRVRDAGATCIITLPVTVAQTAAVTATASATATSCGTSTGTITIAGTTGGTAPYQYSLDGITWQPSNTFNGLPTGNYTIRVRDAGAVCTVTIPVTVPQTGSLAATTSSTAAACTGINNGTITFATAGGTGPYTFAIDGGAAVPGTLPYTFTNVSAGPHTVVVTDLSSNCNSGLLNVTVAAGAGVNGSAVSTVTACPAATNGTITVTATAGTAPFTFQMDAGLPQAGVSPYAFTNVAAGAHTIIIRDNVGCTFTLNHTVMPGAVFAATTGSTPTSCTGVNNGTVTVTPTNGTAPYTYSLDGGAFVAGAAPYTFTNIAAGTHTVIVRDALGCVTNTINVTVTAGSVLTATATPTPTSCSGATNGSITVTPTGGVAPYSFSLDGAAAVTGAAPYTFTNVAAGAHTIVMTDGAGCVTNIINLTVAAGSVLTATATPTATSCIGATNGTITVTPGGGVAPYSFSLDGAAAVTGAAPYTFNNVTAGAHTIVMTDGGGCVTNTINVTVTAGPALTTTVNKTDPLCNGGATGTITVTQPVIGVAPYQYSLDGTTWQAGNTFNGVAAGTYTVYYRESNGCQGNQSITVNQPAVLAASSTLVAVVCNGQNNGTITVAATGGVSPYQYSINGGTTWQAGNVFTVAAGSYTISIRDVNNCTITRAVTVTAPTALAVTSVNTPASCNGGNDGVITVTASGGNAGYQYSLDGVTFQASNVFNVGPGAYTVTVRDNRGCSTTTNTTVTVGSNFVLIPQTDVSICEGASAQLQLTSNATQYSWTPATGLSSTTIANPVANPFVTTQYIVTATFGRCSGNDTIIVTVNPAPVPNAGLDGVGCYGQTYQLQASGGTQYSWSPNTFLNNASIANPVSSPTRNITYTLSILSDINGCASRTTDQVTITVTPPITVRTFPYDTIVHSGDQFQIMATASDSTATNYSWTPANGLSNSTIRNPVATAGVIVGDVIRYQVIATTPAGCRGEGYVTVRIYKGPDIYVPTGFTPNGDGKNDRFIPFPVGMKSYNYFKIFNRWGQLVFSTTKLHDGWDGKLAGKDQSSAVFVWVIEGVTIDGRVIKRTGTVALIR